MKIDDVSLLVTTPTTVPLKKLERDLNRLGYTLGYLPARQNGLTLAKALDLRIPNLHALRYGEIDDICVSLKIQREKKVVLTKNVPRAATGPDFKKIFIGSKGRYGKILEATLRISPVPLVRERLKILWKDPADRGKFTKLLWSSGIRPALIRRNSPRSIAMELEGTKEIVGEENKCLRRYVAQTGGKIARP